MNKKIFKKIYKLSQSVLKCQVSLFCITNNDRNVLSIQGSQIKMSPRMIFVHLKDRTNRVTSHQNLVKNMCLPFSLFFRNRCISLYLLIVHYKSKYSHVLASILYTRQSDNFSLSRPLKCLFTLKWSCPIPASELPMLVIIP